MGVTEWCWTDYPQPQPPRRSGWLEAYGWITQLDPVLTCLNRTEDFSKRRQLYGLLDGFPAIKHQTDFAYPLIGESEQLCDRESVVSLLILVENGDCVTVVRYA